MCTGFTRDTGQYFMKASPVRPGDYLEFFAEIDLLGCMSACPGGDCSAEHSSDARIVPSDDRRDLQGQLGYGMEATRCKRLRPEPRLEAEVNGRWRSIGSSVQTIER